MAGARKDWNPAKADATAGRKYAMDLDFAHKTALGFASSPKHTPEDFKEFVKKEYGETGLTSQRLNNAYGRITKGW